MSVNRGKESVAIDLKHPRGRALVLGLARHADVALENFRPGTAERLGLGPDALRAVQPKLVTCSISSSALMVTRTTPACPATTR